MSEVQSRPVEFLIKFPKGSFSSVSLISALLIYKFKNMKLKKNFIHARNWVVRTAKRASFEIKRDLTLIAFGFVATIANAQTGTAGVGGITTATTDIAKYGPAVQKLMYAIAAVIALVGAFSIYFKMQNGDQDVKKSVMLTVGGCIAMIALATALPAFFGYKW